GGQASNRAAVHPVLLPNLNHRELVVADEVVDGSEGYAIFDRGLRRCQEIASSGHAHNHTRLLTTIYNDHSAHVLYKGSASSPYPAMRKPVGVRTHRCRIARSWRARGSMIDPLPRRYFS